MFTTFRGVSEREWSRTNTYGTKEEFGDYFEKLSDEQLKVRRTTASNAPANVTPQDLEKRAAAEVI
jgi:hypothetical protein